MEPAMQAFRPLPGEDHATAALPEVASWIAIYEELSSVLRLVQSRLNGDPRASDFQRNLSWVEERLALWRDRHQALAGVTIDRKDHSLVFGGRYLKLTRREADLLDFLIRHPGRHFTTRQLTVLAWQNSRLSDAQVRTYMMRLRRRLGEVGLASMITIVRNRGYGAELPS
jgi:DNA-binding response OmpR family regulator